jgi:beta-glucosidase-like glycosyl hydrolase
MLAVAKHVFAYHIESYGADGQYRLSHCFNVTPADFTQTYVAPFRAAALVGNVSFYMCEYGGTNGTNPTRGKPSGPEPWGVPSCLHPLMDATLRAPPEAGGFGWSGSVISDEGSITFAGPGYHGYTSSVVQAACLALNAGTDLALGGEYSTTLRECLASGAVAPARVAQAATRVFTSLMSTGWFDTLAALAEGTLDPVPYNGGTTTLQALWMGVPVVVLAGQHFVSRMGASFMTALNLGDWVARDDEHYVAVAAAMARDREALLELKRGLRSRQQAAAAWNIDQHARSLQEAIRVMWRASCAP